MCVFWSEHRAVGMLRMGSWVKGTQELYYFCNFYVSLELFQNTKFLIG